MHHRIKAAAAALVVAAVTLGTGVGTSAGAGQAAAAPSDRSHAVACPAIPSGRVDDAVRRLAPPFPGRAIPWVVTGQGSAMGCWSKWVQVYPRGATGSSPTHILFFDQDRFISTATRKPTAFTHVVRSAWPGEVTISYRWLIGDDATAHPRGHALVPFQSVPFVAPFPLTPIPGQVLR
ncbi:LppP/LprE family lipoprotein [Gordonia liuliyuniae]|uniref:LppP/LprE family lipoprotein n=1 Tax=Gordonia liuliyuniae TaxID=2911517 RepID=A0ABS9IP55_9ACTN|nr:LppP/LprE family lipoprotein [Gordonia liuliyuniae]MCF8587339.1 LppP/LprE family lipoprotein [Gordonia liuliyuniae]